MAGLIIASGDYPDGQLLWLLRQRPDNHGFDNITEQTGFNWESAARISMSNYDRDGDTDILVGKSWMRMPKDRPHENMPAAALFRNEVGNRNH